MDSQNTPPKKKRGPRIPPQVRAEVLRLLAAGISSREVARRTGVSYGSVRNIRAAAEAQAASAPADPEAPALDPQAPDLIPDAPELTAADAGIADDASPEAALAQVNRMIADLQQLAASAKADGNYTAAARASRDAAGLMPLKARLRLAVEQGSGDAVTIPREQIDREIEAIYGRARTLASVELCPHCGRELRMAAVGAARDEKEKK